MDALARMLIHSHELLDTERRVFKSTCILKSVRLKNPLLAKGLPTALTS